MKATGRTRTIDAGLRQASWPVPAPGVMQRKCVCGGSAGMSGACADCRQKQFLGKPLQAKLRINEPGDAYEQEADRLAEQVMRMPEVDVNERPNDVGSPLVQRRTPDGGTAVAEVPPIVHDVLNSPGQPLNAVTRAFFEPRFGHDFSQVRVHAGERAEQSALELNAFAYTVGRNVVFGSGQYLPGTMEGTRLLAHELAHVIQQAQPSSSPPDRTMHPRTSDRNERTGQMVTRPSGPILQRQTKPTGIVLKEAHPFGHADLKGDEDKKKFRTYIGSTTLMQVTPAANYKGHCTKEYLTEVANTCPARFSELRKEAFCTESKCLDFDRYGSSGDPQTGKMVTDGPDTFIDRHRTRHPDSLLEGTGKNDCSVVCHQKYKFNRKDDLGSFYVIRNFRADKYTPPGEKDALHITTGEVQKVSAGLEAPSYEMFAKDIAPGLKKSGVLLEAPPVPKKAQDKK